MELFLIPVLLVGLLLSALLLTDYVYRMGGTMDERKAVVFEVYRYSVCFIMVIVLGLTAFQMIGALVGDPSNAQALAMPGIGALLSGALFLIHWLMKNPAAPKAS